MLNLRQLEILRAVMRLRTTVGAAREIGMSQPSVSNAIKSMESHLGFPLFHRVNNRLMPTEEARSLKPLRIQVVTAAPGDTAESLAQRMTAVDRPLERFQVLNGLDKGGPVRAGLPYKLVVE